MMGSWRAPGISGLPGFTLIELLVVIAIIGVLASMVLVSLNSARLKSRDTRLISDVTQLRNLMELNSIETGVYTQIKSGGGWYGHTGSCSGMTGTYATQAQTICNDMIDQESVATCVNCIYFRATNPDSPSKYTIMAYLPGASASAGSSQYFCAGVSGRTSTGPTNGWLNPGCYANP